MPDTVTSEVVLKPRQYATQDGPASNYQACWLGCNCDSWLFSVDGDEIWGMFNFNPHTDWPYGANTGLFPPIFQDPAANQGLWGRMFNFHNRADEPGQWGWTHGTPNSAFAVDFINGVWQANIEPENARVDRLNAGTLAKEFDHTLIVNFIAGRTDGTTGRPGSVKIWRDGSDTPVLDLSNINTIYRFNEGGVFYNQKGFYLWTGFYTKALKDGFTLPFKMTYARFGPTLAEMLADTTGGTGGQAIWPTSPPPPVAWELSNVYIGSGPNVGPGTVTKVADTPDAGFLIPSSLGGHGAVTPVNQTLPQISGTAQENETLVVIPGGWTNTPTSLTYQWRRETGAGTGVYADIVGETATAYNAGAGDIGRRLRVVETASNTGGTASATSSPSAAVVADVDPPPTPPADDHWFGYTTVGEASGAMGADGVRGSAYMATENLDLTLARALIEGNIGLGSGTALIRAVVYSMSDSPANGGTPRILLGTSDEMAVDFNDAAAWVEFDFPVPIPVVKNSWYVGGLFTGGTPSSARIFWVPAGATFFFTGGVPYAGGANDSFGTPADTQQRNVAYILAGTPTTTGDLVPPHFVSAEVNVNLLVLSYDEDLDPASVPAPGDFAVEADAVAVDVATVTLDGPDVTLLLDVPVSSSATVTINYTQVQGRDLQDVAANSAANLVDAAVTNVTSSAPAVTGAASNVLPTSFVLNGTVNPGGVDSVAYFDYGTTTNYELGPTVAVAVGDGVVPVPVSAEISGLTPGLTYHYRIVLDDA